MNNRRTLFAIIFVLVFAVAVIGWFFLYATPKEAPSLSGTVDPLSLKTFPKKFQFIFNRDNEETPASESTTEVTFQKPEALTEIWPKPATGQIFTELAVVREVDATSTVGTTTVANKKLVRSTSTILMFVDRTTGYVYAYSRELNKTYQISNTTIPGVYDAYIFNNGKSIVMRYADNDKHAIVGVLATIPSVSDKEQAKPLENVTYLPSQVTSVAVNKKATLLSYLVTGENDASVYTISSKGNTFVASSPFKQWTLLYSGDNLYATSKPSAFVSGQTVSIPSFEAIISEKTGLMSNPSENGIFLNSMWSNKGLRTFLSSGGTQVVLTIKTIASKCSWGKKEFLVCAVPKIAPSGQEGLPDEWFQGRVSFNDSLVTVNPVTSEITPLYSFSTAKKLVFDVVKISLSNDSSLITFNRKQNASLWLLDTTLIEAE